VRKTNRIVNTVACDRLTDRIKLLQACNMSRRAVAAAEQSTSTPAEAKQYHLYIAAIEG
jgi:hypothetical protein